MPVVLPDFARVEVEAYLSRLAHERQLSPHTVASYRHDLSDFFALAAKSGANQIGAVDRRIVRRYIANLTTRGFARRSIARKASSGRAFFADEVRRISPIQYSKSQENSRLQSYLDERKIEKPQGSNIRVAQNVVKSSSGKKQAELKKVSQDDDLLRGPDAQKAISEKAPRPSTRWRTCRRPSVTAGCVASACIPPTGWSGG